jgi:hypothetical protein
MANQPPVTTTTTQQVYLLVKATVRLEEGPPVARTELINTVCEAMVDVLAPGESFYTGKLGAMSAYVMETATVEPVDKAKVRWMEGVKA